MDHEVALEAQEQVLAVGVDRAHRATGQPLGPAVAPESRMRRGDQVGHVTLDDRADPLGRVVDGVAFGHSTMLGRGR